MQQVELPAGLSWWVLSDEGSESPALLIPRQSLKNGVLVGTASRKGEACSVWERPFHNSNPVVPKHRLQGGELWSPQWSAFLVFLQLHYIDSNVFLFTVTSMEGW